MMRHLTGVQGSIAHINQNLGRMAILAGGAVAAFAGFEAVKGVWHVIHASRELNNELTRTRQLGGEFASTIGTARTAAFRTAAQVPTFAPSEMVRMQRELGTQMQNPAAAIEVLPLAAKTAAVVSHYTGEDQETIIKNLIKIVDLRAKLFSMDAQGKEYIDKNKLAPELEAAARGLILGGNYLKSNDLLQMARQSGLPVKTMTQEAFYATMTEMAVSQGAQRAGTSLTSMFSQLVGGIMPKRVAVEMQRMGLLHPGEWTSGRSGGVVVQPQASERFEKALTDPIAYITGPLNDLMNQRHMTSDQKLLEVFRLFGRQTTQRFVAEALSSAPQFARSRAMFADIPSVEQQWNMLQRENLEMNVTAFSKAWTGFMQALGDAGVPSAIGVLQALTGALHELTALVEAHPTAAAILLNLAAALGALMAVGGTLTVATIALRGLVAPLRALAAITGLAELAGGFGLLAAALSRLAGPLGVILGMLPHPTQGPDVDYPGGMRGDRRAPPGAPLGPQGPRGFELTPRGEYRRIPGAPTDEGSPAPRMPPTGPAFGPQQAPQQAPQQRSGDVYLDGRRVGMILLPHLEAELSGPPRGPTHPDIRISAIFPGTAGNWPLA